MPRKDTALYAEIKRVAVSMKVHSKLGGVTHEVAPPVGTLDNTTMLVGADVTHLPPGRGLIQPSIAVSVAGTNGENVRFETCIREQEGRQEIIADLKRMMVSHIGNFGKRTRAKPAKIIFYRDGVSEGQYLQVCNAEVAAIEEVAKEFGAGYAPKATFVICAKRHNMRFFAKSEGRMDRTGNLPPGLVVDTRAAALAQSSDVGPLRNTTVTHPFAFDFYLQAHSGLQGTARPTHYVVLKDENKAS
ncbi:Protein argonaute [Cryptotrichosporon argae]